MTSEQINELAGALAKAQGEIQPATFDKINPHFKTPYASLSACWEAVRGPLSKNGLSVIQMVEYEERGLVLITTLLHSSGQWVRGSMPIAGSTPQQQGSALSYARRYSISACLGIVNGSDLDDEDDDGNATNPDLDSSNLDSPPPPLGTSKDQSVEPEDYIVPVTTKLRGKKLREIPMNQLIGMMDWYQSQMKNGKEFGQQHHQFIDYATRYLEKKPI